MNLYTIHYKGQLDIVAETQEQAEERAMEQLPPDARIEHTECDGEFKPDC